MLLSKKIFLTSTIVLIVLLLFWGIYNLSFNRPAAPTQSSQSSSQTTTTVQNAPLVAAISDEAVLAPTLSSDGEHIEYYSKKTGETYEINFDGSDKQTISNKELPGLANVLWSPDASKVITEFYKANGQPQFYYFNYTTNSAIPLKSNLDTIAWKDNSKIFYKYYDPQTQERTLNIANPDGSDWTKIADLNFKDVIIAPIPKTGLLSFWNTPDANVLSTLYSTPVISGDINTVFTGKYGADYLWSPDGSSVLVSHTDQQGGSRIVLAVIDGDGNNYTNLNSATFVQKCVWSLDDKTIYCAVPDSLPSNAVLPNDYLDGKMTTTDSFWKIDTSTGNKTIIAGPNQLDGKKFDASNLFLNLNESSLFFVNKLDGKLYKINL